VVKKVKGDFQFNLKLVNKIFTSGTLTLTIFLLANVSTSKSNHYQLNENSSFDRIDLKTKSNNWDPPAVQFDIDYEKIFNGEIAIDELIRSGEVLFNAKFSKKDGAGRPSATGDSKPTPRDSKLDIGLTRISGPDAMACASCHINPRVGGSGDFAANVFVGAHFMASPSTSTDNAITNERNTTGLFGSGVVEALAKEISIELRDKRNRAINKSKEINNTVEVNLTSKGIYFGKITVHPNGVIDFTDLDGIDYDLVLRPFGVKGIAASIREFTIAALNQHHGIQAIERFGWERTGMSDFDSDGVENEMSIGNLTALELFQANLPMPYRKHSMDVELRTREVNGEILFSKVGCNSCHKSRLVLENSMINFPNEFNRPGNLKPAHINQGIELNLSHNNENKILVEVYTDFKRHNLCDDEINHFCNEKIKQDNVNTKLFLTSKLWDLSTSAPYGHRGDLLTISEAILAHGGEARLQRDQFLSISEKEKEDLVLFLLTLGKGINVERN